MLLNGNQEDEAKARQWVMEQKRQAKRANIRKRVSIKAEDGFLYHGYTEDISANLEACKVRRQINNEQKQGEIVALAAFSPVAIRNYAGRIGVPAAEMYRNPELMKRMIKDRDYAKFRVNDDAARLL